MYGFVGGPASSLPQQARSRQDLREALGLAKAALKEVQKVHVNSRQSWEVTLNEFIDSAWRHVDFAEQTLNEAEAAYRERNDIKTRQTA